MVSNFGDLCYKIHRCKVVALLVHISRIWSIWRNVNPNVFYFHLLEKRKGKGKPTSRHRQEQKGQDGVTYVMYV